MKDTVPEWVKSSIQWRQDVALYPVRHGSDDLCQPVSLGELAEMAYTLHDLELHCVTDKLTGSTHTEPDRANCGLVFSLGGVYRYVYGNNTFLLENDGILYLPSHSCYAHTFCRAAERRDTGSMEGHTDMLVLNFHLRDPEGVQRILAETPTLLSLDGRRYRAEFLSLAEQFLSPDRQPAELIGRTYSLLAALTKNLLYERKNHRQFQALAPALSLLQETPPGALRVETLIQATYLSPTHFRTLFRAYTGMPPHAYLVQQTLKAALPLLRDTDMTIPEIAERLGFDSPSYFGKYIKKHTGVSPKELQDRSKHTI